MKKDNKLRQYLGWTVTTLTTIVLIILFLPREKTWNYEFTEGKPWRYEQLTTTWDFAVEKNEETWQHEREEAAAHVAPYYVLDPAVATAVTDSLRRQYSAGWSGIMPQRLLNAVTTRLEKVYRDGILSTADYDRMHADSIARVKVILGINSTEQPLSSLRSVVDAYEYVMAADTSAYGTYILRSCNLNDYIKPNLSYEQDKTERARADARDAVIRTKGLVQAGQKVIGAGDIVDADTRLILDSYRRSWIAHEGSAGAGLTLLGQTLLVVLLIASLIAYLALYRRDYLMNPGAYLFLATQVVIFPVISALVMSRASVIIIPFAMAPLMIRVFLDSRTAFITHFIIVLITSIFVPDPYTFILLQFTAGTAAIFSLKELTERSQIFRSALIVLATLCIVWFASQLITVSHIRLIGRGMFIHFLTCAVLLLFTYPLMYLYEKLFHFTSNVTLVELSNINNQLLRTLSEKAPGTFNHSLQVSNLAAAAAHKLQANAQLVRTAALYHDIGKLENAPFFTENQAGINPHTCLPYEQSAQIIIDHVTDGLRMADKYHLPESIKHFIRTHHGLSQTKYFYINYCNEHPNEEVDATPFTYPGPLPDSRETAILMMADAVEAASRSLPEYTEESISNLVNRIIDSQAADGAFAQCPLTFSDLLAVKAVFTEKLRTIYHTRIAYPELKK